MTLTAEEVEHMARLARLALTAAEKELYRSQLSDILDFAARLQTVDTTEVPLNHTALDPDSGQREDRPRPGLSIDNLLSNGPQVEAGQFCLPPVFD